MLYRKRRTGKSLLEGMQIAMTPTCLTTATTPSFHHLTQIRRASGLALRYYRIEARRSPDRIISCTPEKCSKAPPKTPPPRNRGAKTGAVATPRHAAPVFELVLTRDFTRPTHPVGVAWPWFRSGPPTVPPESWLRGCPDE